MRILLSVLFLSSSLVILAATPDLTFEDGAEELSEELKYEFVCSSPLILTRVDVYNFVLYHSKSSFTCWAYCVESAIPAGAPLCSATGDVPQYIACYHGNGQNHQNASCCTWAWFNWSCYESSCPPPTPGGGGGDDDDRSPGNM